MAIALTWQPRPASAAREGLRASGSRSRARVGALALGALVAALLIAIAWTVASAAFSVSLVVFSTDSMAPAMPLGSLAVVQEVAASSVSVGDVVTVERTVDAPPVTQRVVAVGSLVDGSTTLMLRPDNAASHGVVYSVESAKRVVASVPGLGQVMVSVLRPVVLAPLTALLVIASMWVLWPEAPTARSRHAATQRS